MYYELTENCSETFTVLTAQEKNCNEPIACNLKNAFY